MNEPFSSAITEGRRYKLMDTLGKGGFGTVFRGTLWGASGFTKTVAIKLLNEGADETGEFGRRLRDEARLLALLRHRAIVHVDDLVQIKGRWAVVMELIEGADLSQLIRQGPIPPRPACEIVREAASALQVAHEARDPQGGTPLRLVHRDIKPGNIRVTARGEVKVLDFGVARAQFQSREAVTRSLAFGSMGYLSPERFDGIDTPAADIYALGVVLFECLRGARLGQLSVSEQRRGPELEQALGKLPEGMPPDLGRLLLRMLDYDRKARPTAAGVVDQLRELAVAARGPWLERWAAEALEPVQGEVGATAQSEATTLEPHGDAPTPLPDQPTAADAPGPDAAPAAPERAPAPPPPPPPPPPGGEPDPEPPSLDPPPAEASGHGDEEPAEDTSFVPTPPSLSPAERRVAAAPLQEAATAAAELDVVGAGEPRRRSWLRLGALVLGIGTLGILIALGSLAAWRLGTADQVPPAEETPPVEEGAVQEPGQIPVESDAEAAQQDEEEAQEAPAGEPPQPAEEPASATAGHEPTAPPPDPSSGSAAASPVPGGLVVNGDYQEAVLTDAQGASHAPGELPAGIYQLRVTFKEGTTIRYGKDIEVKSGQVVAIQCSAMAQACK